MGVFCMNETKRPRLRQGCDRLFYRSTTPARLLIQSSYSLVRQHYWAWSKNGRILPPMLQSVSYGRQIAGKYAYRCTGTRTGEYAGVIWLKTTSSPTVNRKIVINACASDNTQLSRHAIDSDTPKRIVSNFVPSKKVYFLINTPSQLQSTPVVITPQAPLVYTAHGETRSPTKRLSKRKSCL